MKLRLFSHSIAALGIAVMMTLASCRDRLPIEPGITSDSIAYYQFDQDLTDLTGHGHTGAASALYMDDRFGNARSALSIDGDDSRVTIQHKSDLNFSSERSFTITAWVNPKGTQPEYAGIVCKGPSNSHWPGYQLCVSGDNAYVEVSSSSDANVRGGKIVTDNEWHYLAAVVTAHTGIKLYVDGELDGEVRDPSLFADRDNNAPVFIGQDRNGAAKYRGAVDQVLIMNGALTGAQILERYHEGGWPLDGGNPTTGDPIAQYVFSGDAADITGNGHNGMIVGNVNFIDDRHGSANSAITVDGSSWVEVAHKNDLLFNPGQSYSISAWVKPNGVQSSYAGIVCKGSANSHNPGYQFCVNGNGLMAEISSSDDIFLSGQTDLTDNTWHFVTMVVTAMPGSVLVNVDLYVDGKLESSGSTSAVRDGNTAPLFIGRERNGQFFYNGGIDDITIYAHALTTTEIQTLAQQ